MNFRKIFLFPLVIGCLASCSPSGTSNGLNSKDDKYLQLGETISFGDFSQTLTEFNYVQMYFNSDPNQVEFELRFDVQYSGDKITSFSPSFTAIFDGDKSLGGYYHSYDSKTPSSLAPNDAVSVKANFRCFKDWEKVNITCSFSKDTSTTFEMRSSDYSYPTNNILPVLKAGESVNTADGIATVGVGGIRRVIEGSAGSQNEDNVSITFRVANNTSQKLYFNRFDFSFDSGFSVGLVSVASNTQPTYLDPNASVNFDLILRIQNKDWVNCVVETTFNQKTTLRFNLNHSDYKY